MASVYLIRILDTRDNTYVEWAPGRTIEKDFVRELVQRVGDKGVGIGRTTKHVQADVESACEELILDLKSQV